MLLNTRNILGTVAYLGGVPAVLEEFAWAWAQMVEFNAEYVCSPTSTLYYTRAKVSDHAFARSWLASVMMGDWLLMLDADHAFQPDIVARMVDEFEKNDLDVLSGLYVYKSAPHAPVLFVDDERGTLKHLGAWDVPAGAARYLAPITSSGGGCLMVRRKVFDRIRVELDEQPFNHRGDKSEDHSFFDRCRDLGIKAYACPLIESPHLVVRSVGLKDFDRSAVPMGERISVEG